MAIRNQRRKAAGCMRSRTAWPRNMPANAATIATTPGSAVDAFSSPALVRLKACATVATMKYRPSACTSSSFSMPIDCRNGIDGITWMPVAAEITPVMTPTIPPTHFSFAADTRNWTLTRLMTA